MEAPAPPARLAVSQCLIEANHRIAIVEPNAAQIEAKTDAQYVARAAGAVGELAQLEIPGIGMGEIGEVPWFDIANGNVADARNIFVRPTIAESYHWGVIEGLPRNLAMANSDIFIRVALARLARFPIANQTQVQSRKVALILGMSRAVMTAYYGVEAGHLVPGESTPAVVRYQAATTVEPIQPANLVLLPGVTPEEITAFRAPLAFDAEEKEVLSQVMMCAVGLPALQGLSLVHTSHHYLTGNAEGSRRAFDAVERQFWHTSSQKMWFQSDIDLVRDTMWHKAAHPIFPDQKVGWAMDADIKAIIIKAGAGSAAARLPAEESDLRAGNTIISLCRTVEPMLTSYGGVLDFHHIEAATAAVQMFKPGPPPATTPGGLPAGVNSRAAALEYLAALIHANEGHIAMVFGFYSAQVDTDALTNVDEAPDTLIKSHALQRIRRNSPGSYRAGLTQYRDYVAARTKSRDAGVYVAATVVMNPLPGVN